jgi:large conductance mechanosensitive channel
MIVRSANRMTRRGEDTPAGPTEVELLTEIRDQLRARP